jgi:glycosyltransferase involved in cell wall biosynthesis
MATIALDATYTVDPQPSGIAVYSRQLIENLAELDTPHRFLICYRLSRWSRRRQFLRPRRAKETGPSFDVRLFQEPLTFWLPWQAEVFHSLAQRPPAFRFKKEIVTIHDIFPVTGLDYSTPEFQRKFGALLIEAAHRAARIITPSAYTAGQLVRHLDIPREKIRVIPEGVELPARVLTPEERRRERDGLAGPGETLILNVGVLQTRKNIINVLKALERLPRTYRLALVGGDGHGSEAIHAYIREQALAPRVTLFGHVEAHRLPAFYQAADAFLFPSLEEGFGLPVLEAMANGLPVVAANTSALPEVGGDAALYVNPADPQDIADKVQRVVEDCALRGAMVEKGLKRVQEFTWRRTAEATLAVYEEVLKPGAH